MRTILDDNGDRWFLTAAINQPPRLIVKLSQAIRGQEMPFLEGPTGPIATPGRRLLDITAASRRAEILFANVIAYRVLDDRLTTLTHEEQVDDRGFVVQTVHNALFLRELPGALFEPPWNLADPLLFRVCTLDFVIEVIGLGEPQVRADDII